jgi:hypothetical protein
LVVLGDSWFAIRLGVLERAAVQQIRSDAGSSERMAASGVGEPSLLRPALDHLKDVEPAHCIASEIVTLVDASKQRLFLFRRYSGRLDPIIQVDLEARMAGHLMALATFLMQSQPPALAVLEIISNSHRYRRAHSREAVNHRSDQCPVPQTN